jgi:hypothetical protein
VPLARHEFHGEWNDSMRPAADKPPRRQGSRARPGDLDVTALRYLLQHLPAPVIDAGLAVALAVANTIGIRVALAPGARPDAVAYACGLTIAALALARRRRRCCWRRRRPCSSMWPTTPAPMAQLLPAGPHPGQRPLASPDPRPPPRHPVAPRVPQPDGTMLYAPLTGHPDRLPHDLVFLAARHLEQPWRKPAGRRRHGPRRLAPRPAQGGAAWRADHRGSPGATPAGHDVCA